MQIGDLGNAIAVECHGNTRRNNLHLVDHNLVARDVMSHNEGDACREEHEAKDDSVDQVGCHLGQEDSECPIDDNVNQKEQQNHECDDDAVEYESLHLLFITNFDTFLYHELANLRIRLPFSLFKDKGSKFSNSLIREKY